jgi:hypothetical protein
MIRFTAAAKNEQNRLTPNAEIRRGRVTVSIKFGNVCLAVLNTTEARGITVIKLSIVTVTPRLIPNPGIICFLFPVLFFIDLIEYSSVTEVNRLSFGPASEMADVNQVNVKVEYIRVFL